MASHSLPKNCALDPRRTVTTVAAMTSRALLPIGVLRSRYIPSGVCTGQYREGGADSNVCMVERRIIQPGKLAPIPEVTSSLVTVA
jgi:hypothetical protein